MEKIVNVERVKIDKITEMRDKGVSEMNAKFSQVPLATILRKK